MKKLPDVDVPVITLEDALKITLLIVVILILLLGGMCWLIGSIFS